MRFTCDDCGTRYRLDDEKARGRLVEVRCRKCAGIVTLRDGEKVRPDETDELRANERTVVDPPISTRALDGADVGLPNVARDGGNVLAAEAEPPKEPAARRWFALVGGEQTGPLSDDALDQQIEAGIVHSSTFVWCDGMAEWKRLADVSR